MVDRGRCFSLFQYSRIAGILFRVFNETFSWRRSGFARARAAVVDGVVTAAAVAIAMAAAVVDMVDVAVAAAAAAEDHDDARVG